MELFSPEFWSALLAIVLIDLVLAGDNAIVIGLAARNVPKEMQKKVIFWGTFGAIAIRALLTLVVVWLLKIPGFLLAGGLALVWIAMKLVKPEDEKDGHHIESHSSVRKAIQTIVIADAVMGVDNVLAIGGAAHGSMLLVVLGLLISVPIVVWGSQLILKWVEKYPSIILIGAGVLGWTAVKMIANEPLIKEIVANSHQLRILLYVIVLGLIMVPPLVRYLPENKRVLGILLPFLIVWLTGFDILEEHYHLHPLDDWFWIDDVVDIVMWVGWIPFAVLIYKKHQAKATAADA
ncbi:TerC family protein [Parvibium lacunae]|uniref:TerC family protein n=1 Tax=Parvibium lacunae TaxID=1888893 RepID=A0A368KYE4_9BURK|nr:TerC family protein [Parvibium lacunae]